MAQLKRLIGLNSPLKTPGFLGEHIGWIEPFCDPVHPSELYNCKVEVEVGKRESCRYLIS